MHVTATSRYQSGQDKSGEKPFIKLPEEPTIMVYRPTMLGVVASVFGSGVQTDVTTSNNVGKCNASWEERNP